MQSSSEMKNSGVYTYTAQWPISSLAWSVRRDKKARLAIASFLHDYTNKVQLVHFNQETSPDHHFSTDPRLIFNHPYAPTNLMFFPSDDTLNPDLLVTSGDYLRLWEIHDDQIDLKALLNSNKSEFNAAITSFDWAEFDHRKVATSSVDTTCSVWDIEGEIVETQLVAHEKEVYDISWGGVNVFGSVSGDGSVRVFDLRDKERSTIIYENNCIPQSALLRLEWNKCDPRFIATFGMDSNKVVVLDIRYPTTPLMELKKHKASVNSISWGPQNARHLCSVGDDSNALIWEVAAVEADFRGGDDVEPVMWFGSTSEINHVRWSPIDLESIAIGFLNKLQILKV